MSQHFRKGVTRKDIEAWDWKNAKLAKSIFESGWEWNRNGYYMKHIRRIDADSEINACDIHITVNALNGNSKQWRLNSPHVTYQYEGQQDDAYHVYYDFINDGGVVSLQYLYTDRSDDVKWRESAFIILRDDSDWGCTMVGDHSGE